MNYPLRREALPIMVDSLLWMPRVLLDAGLKIAEVDGWQGRGHGPMSAVLGVMCHHTAGPHTGNMPSLRILIDGRPDLAGPLAQLGLGRDGTFYIVAAGRCWHAGPGEWRGITAGNSHFIGIEAENTGKSDDTPWPTVQLDAYACGAAAILAHLGRGADDCAGHKEFARPSGRKPDPNFDMAAFRVQVAGFMAGTLVPRSAIPARETPGTDPTRPPRATLRRGASGEMVTYLQGKLALPNPDGIFGPRTEAAVREFQRSHGAVPDGIVGPRTWQLLDHGP